MLKYKYVIDSGNFSSIEEFQAYLNRMGKKGYELVQWQLVNFVNCCIKIQPTSDTLSILITWKMEDHDS
jgi:hypothetical protein